MACRPMTATVDHTAAKRLCGCSLTNESLEWPAVSVNEQVNITSPKFRAVAILADVAEPAICERVVPLQRHSERFGRDVAGGFGSNAPER